ncbi:MAG: exodeoxyribonuclease III [Pseudomonadota bacterium]
MKITTWNINSVRLRIDQVVRFLEAEQPDVLCLQEIKCNDDQFPAKPLTKIGYDHIAVHGQKAYHGVAIVARVPLSDVARHDFCAMGDARHLQARAGGIDIHNFYVPAGGDEPDPVSNEKFAHKLSFLDEMATWSEGLCDTPRRKKVLVGDLNVAPSPDDVWSHKQLLKVVSHTPIEVAKLDAARVAGGWTDVARALIPEPEKLYSWWSYRARDWRASNRGRRLDHIWVNGALKKAALGGGRDAYGIHDEARGWEKPSDHAPVSLTLGV